jgi:hypothetical protein
MLVPMMPLEMTIAFSLIGIGALVAAGAGLRLPPGERLGALLALVAGGGVGVVALAIGGSLTDVDGDGSETVFLVASILGFVTTTVTVGAVVAAARRNPRVSDRDG